MEVDLRQFKPFPLWWLLRTSVRKIGEVALESFIFPGAVAFTNEGIQEPFSCLSIHHAEVYTVHPLLQWEMTRRKVLSSMFQTR